MKKTIILAVIYFLTINCKAQSPVINIKDFNGTPINNAYYKDIDNLLNPFEGTYLYTNGNTSFKIVLQKSIALNYGKYYQDLLVGEYQYIQNGIEKVNSLSNLSNNAIMHQIFGNGILENNNKPHCTDCNPNEKRVSLSFFDPNNELYGRIIIRKIMIGTQQAIKVKIKATGSGTLWIEGQPQPPTDFTVPAGEYILMKQ